MNKKYTHYAILTCVLFILIALTVALIIDMSMHLQWQLMFAMLLLCVACIPLWLILGDVLSQYYESEAKRRSRRKLLVVPYTHPTKQELPIVSAKPSADIDTDIKVYTNTREDIELRRIITDVASEADTQIYSIKKHAD